jgi:hypothetical protein
MATLLSELTGCWLGGRGSILGRDKISFSSPQGPGRRWGPHSLLSSELKAAGREADHSPPSNTEVKNSGTISLLLHTSSGVVLN